MSSQVFTVLFSVFISVFSLSAFAQSYHSTYRNTSTYASEHHHYVSGALGFLAPGQNQLNGTNPAGVQVTRAFTLSGLFGIGGDYDYMISKDYSFGGVLRYYNVSTTINGQSYQNSLFTLGPDFRVYLPMGNTWTPYASAGLVYLSPSLTFAGEAVTLSSGIGVMASMGITYQLTDTVALGLETMRLMGLSNTINGNLVEDYMFKIRFPIAD